MQETYVASAIAAGGAFEGLCQKSPNRPFAADLVPVRKGLCLHFQVSDRPLAGEAGQIPIRCNDR